MEAIIILVSINNVFVNRIFVVYLRCVILLAEQISHGVYLEIKFAVTLDEDSFLPYISVFIP